MNCVIQHRAVGIVLLVVVLAALLVLGCWYFKKRNGYKIIRVRPSNQYIRHLMCLCLYHTWYKAISTRVALSINMMWFTHVKMVIWLTSFQRPVFLFVLQFTLLLSCSHQFITQPLHIFYSPPQNARSGSPSYTGGQYSETGPSAENKTALTNFGSFRPAVRDRKLPYQKAGYKSILPV